MTGSIQWRGVRGGVKGLRGTSGNGAEASSSSPSVVGVLAGSSSIPSNSTSTPTADNVTGSDTLGQTYSGAMAGSVLLSDSGLCIVAGLSPPSAVGSGIVSMQWGDDWLGSGSGAVLVTSSSVGQMVNGDPQFTSIHSTNMAKS